MTYVRVRQPEEFDPNYRDLGYDVPKGGSLTITGVWIGVRIPDMGNVLVKSAVVIEGLGTGHPVITLCRASRAIVPGTSKGSSRWQRFAAAIATHWEKGKVT